MLHDRLSVSLHCFKEYVQGTSQAWTSRAHECSKLRSTAGPVRCSPTRREGMPTERSAFTRNIDSPVAEAWPVLIT